VSRYVFTSGLSYLEHKKVMRTNHATSVAFNGRLTASAHAASTTRQLSTVYLCNGLGVNCIWRTRLGCNQMDQMVLVLQHTGCGVT
jgi:hypothetical protein